MKRITLFLACALVVLVFIVSCNKIHSTPQTQAGPAGPEGPVGPAGRNGTIIYSGNGAPNAGTGIIGDFYLDLSNGLLFGPKTTSGWGTGYSLGGGTSGSTGPAGPSGPSGPAGPAGPTGPAGPAGSVGGGSGNGGTAGPAGPAGPTGPAGPAGANGSKIYSGSGAPAGSIGINGDYYLDKTNYELYGPKANAGWGTPVSLQGPPGAANVIYSDWNLATNVRDDMIDGSRVNIADLAAPSLISDYITTATIQVYFNSGAGIFPLPYTSNSGGKSNTISFQPQAGNILIVRFTIDNSRSVKLSANSQYRFVIIPGGVNVPHLADYEATLRYLRIPDKN